jgi:DNA-binding MarR family transcriptional regulator
MADLDDPRLDALGMLIEAHAAVMAAVGDDLAESSDMPVAFLGVLLRLGRSPGEQLRMTQLAHEMSITTSGLTRLVDRMEQVGLVERRPCPGDGRGLLAGLTPAGRRRLDAVLPVHLAQIEERFTRHLSAAERETLTSLLRSVRDGVRGES